VVLAGMLLALGVLAAAADAYYQSYRTYRDVQAALPSLRQVSDYLAKGQLPPNDPFGRADAAVGRARKDVAEARFTFKLVGMLPWLGRPVDAVRRGVSAASGVTKAALITQRAVTDLLGDAARNPGSVRAAETPLYEGGSVNVELLRSVTPRLEEVLSLLRGADRDIRAIPGVPLIPQVKEAKEEALANSTRAIRLSERMLSGVGLLPPLLGADQKKTYLVALQNGADLRGTGGGILAYAIVTIDKGRFRLVRGGGINDIDARFQSGQIDTRLTPGTQWYVDHVPDSPQPNAMSYSPNFPQAATMWARMVARVTGLRMDGVIEMDQTAVARLLSTRRVRVPAYPKAITGSNLVRVVGHDQYLLPQQQQIEFPEQLIIAAWPEILDPTSLLGFLQSMGDSLHERRIQLWSVDRRLQGPLARLGWDGGIRVRPGDYLYVVDNKIAPGKVDYYGRVSIDYSVTIDRSGDGIATLAATLANNSPRGLPRSIAGTPERVGGYAVNRALMLAFVPKRAKLLEASPTRGLPDHEEAGAMVFGRTIRANAGKSATMRLRYQLPGVVLSSDGHKLYRLVVQHQPLLVPATLKVTITLPQGTRVLSVPPGWSVSGNVLTLETDLARDIVLEISF
jgi:uncharacterized protein DUF4012